MSPPWPQASGGDEILGGKKEKKKKNKRTTFLTFPAANEICISSPGSSLRGERSRTPLEPWRSQPAAWQEGGEEPGKPRRRPRDVPETCPPSPIAPGSLRLPWALPTPMSHSSPGRVSANQHTHPRRFRSPLGQKPCWLGHHQLCSAPHGTRTTAAGAPCLRCHINRHYYWALQE